MYPSYQELRIVLEKGSECIRMFDLLPLHADFAEHSALTRIDSPGDLLPSEVHFHAARADHVDEGIAYARQADKPYLSALSRPARAVLLSKLHECFETRILRPLGNHVKHVYGGPRPPARRTSSAAARTTWLTAWRALGAAALDATPNSTIAVQFSSVPHTLVKIRFRK